MIISWSSGILGSPKCHCLQIFSGVVQFLQKTISQFLNININLDYGILSLGMGRMRTLQYFYSIFSICYHTHDKECIFFLMGVGIEMYKYLVVRDKRKDLHMGVEFNLSFFRFSKTVFIFCPCSITHVFRDS